MCTRKDVSLQKIDALLRRCMAEHSDWGRHCFTSGIASPCTMEYCMWTPHLMARLRNCWLLLFPLHIWHAALNGMDWDARHQGQQRMLALAQERIWWSKMEDDCQALVQGCQCCKVFEGVVVKAPLCPIQAYAPLELVHVNFTSIETTMELNQPPSVKNVFVFMDHFTRYMMAFVTKDQKANTVTHILYEWCISRFWCASETAQWTWHELHVYTCWRALLSLWHSKVQDDHIPHTMLWTGGKIPSDAVLNDWKVGCGQ